MGTKKLAIEIYLRDGFSEIELSSIIGTLRKASEIQTHFEATVSLISKSGGLVNSHGGMLARTDPIIRDQYLKDMLFVLGGSSDGKSVCSTRMRAMSRLGRPVVLLSESATEYIQSVQAFDETLATQWQDVFFLKESKFWIDYSVNLCVQVGQIFLGAGGMHTSELILNFLSEHLDEVDIAMIAQHLQLSEIRSFRQLQPVALHRFSTLFPAGIRPALEQMEAQIETPVSMKEIARNSGLSSRQMERLFREHLGVTPSNFLKSIKARLARNLVLKTSIPLDQVALASGFKTLPTMNRVFSREFKASPHQERKIGLELRKRNTRATRKLR